MTWTPWVGGRKRTVEGTTTWYIRRRVGGGARVEIPVATDERKAMAELALFEDNPAGYVPPKKRAAERLKEGDGAAVRLDPATLETFLTYARGLVKKGELTEDYVEYTLAPYLVAWTKALAGRDLHKVTLDHLQAALRHKDWQTAQHKRVVALKAFTAWARETKEWPKLRRAGDPTLDLKTPEVIPEKKRRKKGYSIEYVQRLYAALPSQAARDMLRLRACAHGMHNSEIDRLARGDGELLRVSDPSGIEGLLVFHHEKKREDHAIPVDAATFAAAERLRGRGAAVSRAALRTMLQRVAIRWHGCGGRTTARVNKRGLKVWETAPCKECDIIRPSELRHSFATWARKHGRKVFAVNQEGVDLETVKEAMGHKSKRTTAGFYVGDHIPVMIAVPLNLHHPEDPTQLESARAPRRLAH